jgi:hypothetical protein
MPLSFSTAADHLRGRLTRASMVSSDDHLEVTVPQFSVAEAKARLSQLIQKALAGEDEGIPCLWTHGRDGAAGCGDRDNLGTVLPRGTSTPRRVCLEKNAHNARDLNDPFQVASRILVARPGSIEVRPIMENVDGGPRSFWSVSATSWTLSGTHC